MGKVVCVLVCGMLGGCGTPQGTPIDVASTYTVVLCLLNCPVTAMNADEGFNTDALEQKPVHILPENVRTVRGIVVTQE